jgi:hypothetical protein
VLAKWSVLAHGTWFFGAKEPFGSTRKLERSSRHMAHGFLELRHLSEVLASSYVPPGTWFFGAKEPFGSTRKLVRSSRQRNLSEVFVPHTFLQALQARSSRHTFLQAYVPPGTAFSSVSSSRANHCSTFAAPAWGCAVASDLSIDGPNREPAEANCHYIRLRLAHQRMVPPSPFPPHLQPSPEQQNLAHAFLHPLSSVGSRPRVLRLGAEIRRRRATLERN